MSRPNLGDFTWFSRISKKSCGLCNSPCFIIDRHFTSCSHYIVCTIKPVFYQVTLFSLKNHFYTNIRLLAPYLSMKQYAFMQSKMMILFPICLKIKIKKPSKLQINWGTNLITAYITKNILCICSSEFKVLFMKISFLGVSMFF